VLGEELGHGAEGISRDNHIASAALGQRWAALAGRLSCGWRLCRGVQVGGGPAGIVLGLDQLGVEPLGHGGITQRLRVIAQVMRHHGQHVAALVQPNTEGAIPHQPLHDLQDVVGSRHLVGIGVIVAQAAAAPDAQQLPVFGQGSLHPPQAAADAVPLEFGIDDDLVLSA
jgi:hypothetical protein